MHDESTLVPQQSPLSVTRYLRWAGTCILLLACSDFLMKGIGDLMPNYRNYLALALATVLTGCGLLSGYRWRDAVGARWFFVLAVACAPVQYAQIGAALWDRYGHVGTMTQQSSIGVLVNLLVSTVIFLPIVWTGLRTLDRERAPALVQRILSGCLVLLIPLRYEPMAPLLVLAVYVLNNLHARHGMKSVSGTKSLGLYAAELASWLPLILLAVRGIYYASGSMDTAVYLSFCASVVLRELRGLSTKPWWRWLCFQFGLMMLSTAWLCFSTTLIGRYALYVPVSMNFEILPLAFIWFALAPLADRPAVPRGIAGLTMAVTLVGGLGAFGGYNQATLALLAGVGLTAVALHFRERMLLLSGLASAVGGVLYYLQGVGDLYSASPWLLLTAAGVAILLLASYLEARGRQLMTQGKRVWLELRQWS